jgi:hypothetical protein
METLVERNQDNNWLGYQVSKKFANSICDNISKL